MKQKIKFIEEKLNSNCFYKANRLYAKIKIRQPILKIQIFNLWYLKKFKLLNWDSNPVRLIFSS